MKKIESVIRPHQLDSLMEALALVGVSDVMVSEVNGVGRRAAVGEPNVRSDYGIAFRRQVKIEALVTPELLVAATAAVMTVARADSVGEGTIMIVGVDHAVSIGKGKHGRGAP